MEYEGNSFMMVFQREQKKGTQYNPANNTLVAYLNISFEVLFLFPSHFRGTKAKCRGVLAKQ